MVVNTINELTALLNLADQDVTVLGAISNDSATATGSGVGPGLVTTRDGGSVKNVQKVIADIESGIVAGVRPTIDQVNPQTGTSYTAAISDVNAIITMQNAAANVFTIDPVATTLYPVGFTCEIIQLGAGATTIQAGAAVDLNGVTAGGGAIAAQYSVVKIRHVASDIWIVDGDISAIA
jgi:hypothetical protein